MEIIFEQETVSLPIIEQNKSSTFTYLEINGDGWFYDIDTTLLTSWSVPVRLVTTFLTTMVFWSTLSLILFLHFSNFSLVYQLHNPIIFIILGIFCILSYFIHIYDCIHCPINRIIHSNRTILSHNIDYNNSESIRLNNGDKIDSIICEIIATSNNILAIWDIECYHNETLNKSANSNYYDTGNNDYGYSNNTIRTKIVTLKQQAMWESTNCIDISDNIQLYWKNIVIDKINQLNEMYYEISDYYDNKCLKWMFFSKPKWLFINFVFDFGFISPEYEQDKNTFIEKFRYHDTSAHFNENIIFENDNPYIDSTNGYKWYCFPNNNNSNNNNNSGPRKECFACVNIMQNNTFGKKQCCLSSKFWFWLSCFLFYSILFRIYVHSCVRTMTVKILIKKRIS